MKRTSITAIALLALAVCAPALHASGKKDADKAGNAEWVASTSWTAAFADLAGIDGVTAIAPASLRHPPEYEVTVSDIQRIAGSTYFVYAGFEVMMQTLGNAVGDTQMVRIQCDNSVATVQKNAELLSALSGTQQESQRRVARYKAAVQSAAQELASRGLTGAKVLCNANQVYLARDLGLDVAATFGPAPVTAEQIASAKNAGYALIIDNVHNPVAAPLAQVSPQSRLVIWRNFPERVEPDALLHVIEQNIAALLEALQ